MIYDQSLDTPMPRCEYWLMASDTVHGNVWLRKFTYNEFAEQFWVTAYAVNSTTSVSTHANLKVWQTCEPNGIVSSRLTVGTQTGE